MDWDDYYYYQDEDDDQVYDDIDTFQLAKESGPKPELADPLLFKICMPIILFGVAMNLISLWVWSSMKCGFQHMVFLFKAMCLSDALYLGFYFPAKLWDFKNVHLTVFFKVLLRGVRSVGIYIALLLAIARFVRLFDPIHTQRFMSRFRLKLMLLLIIVCCTCLQTFISSSNFYLPQSYRKIVRLSIRNGPLMSFPAIAQNVLMGLVLWKIWQGSRKLHLMNESMISTSERVHRRSSYVVPFSEETKSSYEKETPHKQEHERKTPGDKARPMTPQTPKGTESSAGPQLQPVCESGHSHPSLQTAQTPTEPGTAGERTHSGKTLTHSGMKKTSKTGLQQRREEEEVIAPAGPTDLTAGGMPENNSNANSNDDNNASEQTPLGAPPQTKKVTFPQAHEPRIRTQHAEWRVTLVVLAICLCTFIAFPVLSIMKISRIAAQKPKTTETKYIRTMIKLLNSCLDALFYFFVNRFRLALKEKLIHFVETFLVSSGSFSSMAGTLWSRWTGRSATVGKSSPICCPGGGGAEH